MKRRRISIPSSSSSEVPYFDKYDELLPKELVRKGFAEGVLDIEGMRERVREWVR